MTNEITIDEDGNLVTKMKKVWVSCDESGWFSLWQYGPVWNECLENFTGSRKEQNSVCGLTAMLTDKHIGSSGLFAWLKANVRNTKNSRPINCLPKPGEVWEVTLY